MSNNNNKERVLAFNLATPISKEELSTINGGTGTNPTTSRFTRVYTAVVNDYVLDHH